MFPHEALDVYKVSLEFNQWAKQVCRRLNSMNRSLHEQMIRAADSILLNIAEGNGKRAGADRKRYFESARGSSAECAAIIDILRTSEVIRPNEADHAKELLNRIAAMLTKMIR
ncbi:MAG: four helix bundle protein [Bacteroidetes bacterium]|nr:four helix bundle protein [Bacteroidota bacterium]